MLRVNTNQTAGLYFKNKPFVFLFSILLFSLLLFVVAFYEGDHFDSVMSVASYLTWHNLFEMGSILVCFSVFVVSYYTYNLNRRLRNIFPGSFLLLTGLIDVFHTLSFKGMPDFFVQNVSANRATTYWIISRTITALCFLILSLIHVDRKSRVNKGVFVLFAVLTAFAVFIIGTYFPNFFPVMYVDGKGLTQAKILMEYVIIVLFAAAGLKFFVEYWKGRDYLIMLACGAMLLNIFSEIAFVSYSQVYDIFNYIGHVYKIISFFIIFKVIFVRNVQMPYYQLSEARQELSEYARNLDQMVDQRTRQLKQVNRLLLDDLEYARDIQKAMLPTVMPYTEKVSFNTTYYPAERLSGDFYDVFRLDENHIGFYICDVSGHGVPAAMLTVFLKQCIDARREMDMETGRISTPSEMLQNVYESFNNTNFKEDVYIVLIYAVIDTAGNTLNYGSAGMNVAPVIISREDGVSELPIQGFPICKFKNIIDVEYQDRSLELHSGQKILFHTDGLTEAENVRGEQFGAERLIKLLEETRQLPGEVISDRISDSLFRFTDKHRLKDDITYIVVDFK